MTKRHTPHVPVTSGHRGTTLARQSAKKQIRLSPPTHTCSCDTSLFSCLRCSPIGTPAKRAKPVTLVTLVTLAATITVVTPAAHSKGRQSRLATNVHPAVCARTREARPAQEGGATNSQAGSHGGRLAGSGPGLVVAAWPGTAHPPRSTMPLLPQAAWKPPWG